MTASVIIALVLLLCGIPVCVCVALFLVPVEVTTALRCRRTVTAWIVVRWGAFSLCYLQEETGEGAFRIFCRPVLRFGEKEEKGEVKPATAPMAPGERLQELIEIWPEVKKPAKALIRALTLSHCVCEMRVGFHDAALTGTVYGWLMALQGMLRPAERVRLSVDPAFGEEVIEGAASLGIAIERPLLVVIPLIGALTKKPVREMMRKSGQVSGP